MPPLISSSSSVGVAPVESDAQKDLSVVSRTASMVPSIFGEGTVAGSSSAGEVAAAKPGKNLKFCVFFCVCFLCIYIYMGLFNALCVCVLARARKIKTLKPSYFVSGVVGTFVGFPRNKRVIDGYARCLLCRADLSIAGRGLSSLWDHWKGVEHTRLEQKYRIMTHRPLLDKSCRLVSAEEDRRIRRARLTEPPVFLESALKLTVEERIAIEEA